MTTVPNPGSPEALAQGCLCPVDDNDNGRGWQGFSRLFVMVADCPIHGSPEVHCDGGDAQE